MRGLELFILFIIMIILVIIAVLIAIASIRITSIKDYQSDPFLSRAHQLLTWAAIAEWLGLIILAAIAAFYFSRSTNEAGVKILFGVVVFLTFVEGIVAAVAATEMDKTTGTIRTELDATNARALTNWASILGIVGAVLAVILLIVSYYRRTTKKTKKALKQKKEETEEEETEEEKEEKEKPKEMTKRKKQVPEEESEEEPLKNE